MAEGRGKMTYHDLREREQHEGRAERTARHAQHLHTTPATDHNLISIRVGKEVAHR